MGIVYIILTEFLIAGLEYNAITSVRTADTAYILESNSSTTSRDEMWNSINLDRLVVVLDDEEVEHFGLPKSDPFIWDQTKHTYSISVYHQLHCLVYESPSKAYRLIYYSVPNLHDIPHRNFFTQGYQKKKRIFLELRPLSIWFIASIPCVRMSCV